MPSVTTRWDCVAGPGSREGARYRNMSQPPGFWEAVAQGLRVPGLSGMLSHLIARS